MRNEKIIENMGQLQWMLLWYPLLFLLCTAAFSLLISALGRNNVIAVSISLFLLLALAFCRRKNAS